MKSSCRTTSTRGYIKAKSELFDSWPSGCVLPYLLELMRQGLTSLRTKGMTLDYSWANLFLG